LTVEAHAILNSNAVLKTLHTQSHPIFKTGYLPIGLRPALIAVEVPKETVKQVCLEIQTCIAWTFSAGWKERCRRVWSERRQQAAASAAPDLTDPAEIAEYFEELARYYGVEIPEYEEETIEQGNVEAAGAGSAAAGSGSVEQRDAR
jgi:L-lactate utilization protein LutC